MVETTPDLITASNNSAQDGLYEQPSVEVPARPALAPGVRLVGEMQGSGFEQQQWLIERNGQFVQLTELLYRVAEQMDGERTLDEIAEQVTALTEWLVSADNVEQIIRAKLLPLGVVAGTDGEAILPVGAAAVGQSSSPLGVNMRMKVISPRIINPIADVLKTLYAPPILIPVLAVALIAHGWLYLRNSNAVLQGVLHVLYTPGLLVAVLGILVISALFHELGHASALRYGGGYPRGMGVGVYLVYPAFYTDVTDSYRLGKWARVRTDLGGVYFHLIFALALIGIYLTTGQDFVLLAVVLISSEVLRQFIPFARLDGYWVLADLAGVPDFFSQIVPFAKSLLPGARLPGASLPSLKPWVRVVFALFVVLTIPTLTVLLVLMVATLPSLVATSWDSFSSHAAKLAEAWSHGIVVGVVLISLQMLVLALPVVGTVYLLFVIIRPAVRALWTWGRTTWTRRLAAALVTLAALAAIALFWAPQVSAIAQPGPPGTQSFPVSGRDHVQTRVSYPQTPPVGGNHAPVWQNCGFYDAPIRSENGVHSLEHGAVWITYRPDLSQREVQQLGKLARGQTYVLVSPYTGLPSPVVASAWGYQLKLTTVDDPRLERFIQTFRLGSQAPEKGGSCTDGLGLPK